ncbi:MAG TPA: hypothetical protein VHB79_18440 [Polyangiaceae bacterium]|nr:hypothetical protein [Polyangiaceae bacterium]
MPAPIVVEVSAPEPRPAELTALIAACSRAATPNECITSDVKGSDPPLGVAIVRREGDRARIELGLRGGKSAEWSTRDLIFQPGDDELERYRAIGFAIGTLVAKQVEPSAPVASGPSASGSADASPSKPSEASRTSAPPPGRAPAAPAVTAPQPIVPRATWLELVGSTGLALIPGPPRFGGALRAASELRPRGLFVVAETSYAERWGEPSLRVRWLGMSLGVGQPLAPSLRTLGLDVRLAFAVQRLALTAQDEERSAGDSRWKPGISVALDAHWEVTPPLSILLGASTFVDPKRTVVEVGGTSVGETPALGLDGFLGLRMNLR